MIIDLNKLLYEDSININEKISYNEDYLKNTDILKLDDVLVDGKIIRDYEENTVINLNVKGTMFLTDAITTLSVPYDFAIEIEEILENSAKTLDLIEFLWHYIVLEIPIRYTTSDVKELKNTYNQVYDEGWKENNNPFKDFFGE
ncbi:MAG: hypothetical protein IKN63_02355 [Bacilli bacterium]|nr:hypothetical protein [Bacilli bacterium]